ncbi:MAG TPA: type VI secretion system ImpA family N-terminal domain-containing protein [Bryobacteraceae bacterium]|jgi:type VI secretion system ImpA family protein
MAAQSTALEFDIEQLLAPVSEDNPVGEDLRRTTVKGKSMLMAEIEEKRKAILSGTNENLEPDQQMDAASLAQLRRSGWREIEKMLLGAFSQGKELGAAVYFAQAAVVSHGWPAVGPCLRFIRLLQERFGEALFPIAEVDDNGTLDFIDRLVVLERLDHENFLPLAVRQLSMTDPRGGTEVSWADFKRVEIMKETARGKDEDPEVRRQMIENATNALNDAVMKCSLAHYEALLATIRDASADLSALRDYVDQQYAGASETDRPTFRRTQEALEDCENLAAQFVRKKGGGQTKPDADFPNDSAASDGNLQSTGVSASSDAEAILLLERALGWFRVHQRHNPATFLVEEAIRWTRMPIAAWYLEASEDANMSGFVSKLMRKNQEGSE